jgi:hypothetical protein
MERDLEEQETMEPVSIGEAKYRKGQTVRIRVQNMEKTGVIKSLQVLGGKILYEVKFGSMGAAVPEDQILEVIETVNGGKRKTRRRRRGKSLRRRRRT